MQDQEYKVTALLRDGQEKATFPKSREGLTAAYEFVREAFAWEIACGSEIVDQCDPFSEFDPAELCDPAELGAPVEHDSPESEDKYLDAIYEDRFA